MAMICNSSEIEWDVAARFATFAINTTKQTATGYTPFELIYSRIARLPQDPLNATTVESDYVKSLAMRLELMHLNAYNNNEERHASDKDRYDAGHRESIYKVGDTIMIFFPPKSINSSSKLTDRYAGPYRITHELGNNIYRAKLLDDSTRRKKSIIAHSRRFKKCADPQVQGPQPSGNDEDRTPGNNDDHPTDTSERQQTVPIRPDHDYARVQTMKLALLLLGVLNVVNALHPEDLLIWQPYRMPILTSKTYYESDVIFVDPCPTLFGSITAMPVTNEAYTSLCQQRFKELVIAPLNRLCPDGITGNARLVDPFSLAVLATATVTIVNGMYIVDQRMNINKDLEGKDEQLINRTNEIAEQLNIVTLALNVTREQFINGQATQMKILRRFEEDIDTLKNIAATAPYVNHMYIQTMQRFDKIGSRIEDLREKLKGKRMGIIIKHIHTQRRIFITIKTARLHHKRKESYTP